MEDFKIIYNYFYVSSSAALVHLEDGVELNSLWSWVFSLRRGFSWSVHNWRCVGFQFVSWRRGFIMIKTCYGLA